MSCPRHVGEVIIPAGQAGWVQRAAGPADPGAGLGQADRVLALRPEAPGPWSIYATYASPRVAELTPMANDWRAPSFLELRWAFDGARETIHRAPIPAVGLCLSTPCPPAAWVGRYIVTQNDVSVLVQAAPGRPSRAWVGSAPSFTPIDGVQAIPDFACRVQSTGSSAALIDWLDVNGSSLYTSSVADVAAVDPRARYYVLDDVSGSIAFEVIA